MSDVTKKPWKRRGPPPPISDLIGKMPPELESPPSQPETPEHIHDFGEWGLIVPTVEDALFTAIPSESRFCAPCGLYEIRVLEQIPEPPQPETVLEWEEIKRSRDGGRRWFSGPWMIDDAGEWDENANAQNELYEINWCCDEDRTFVVYRVTLEGAKSLCQRISSVLDSAQGDAP